MRTLNNQIAELRGVRIDAETIGWDRICGLSVDNVVTALSELSNFLDAKFPDLNSEFINYLEGKDGSA